MLETFGARLRQRREDQGIALNTIAERTKIKQSLLEALERDDVSQWPSGFYRRAFIRAYAHAIDLDPDVVLREFQEVHPEPPAVDVLVAMASTLDRTQARSSSGIRTVVGSAIASLSRMRRSPTADDPAVGDAAPTSETMAAVPPPRVASSPARTPTQGESRDETVAESLFGSQPAPFEPDLLAFAHLCTEFGRVADTAEIQPLLQEAARILDAIGLIVWLWDSPAEQLRPALVHGYSEKVIALLPCVRRDADNATAAAFRSAQTCAIGDNHPERGALVVPLLSPTGCAGVLAIELPRGREQSKPVLAVATILAAVLAQLTGTVAPAEAASRGVAV